MYIRVDETELQEMDGLVQKLLADKVPAADFRRYSRPLKLFIYVGWLLKKIMEVGEMGVRQREALIYNGISEKTHK